MIDLITVDVNVTAQPDDPVFISTPVENAVEGSSLYLRCRCYGC